MTERSSANPESSKVQESCLRSSCTPSRLHFKQHFHITKFIMEAGHKLQLPPVACASACVLYHRFFKQYTHQDYDPTLVGTTALYLASKSEEVLCKLRDVINVSYRTLHKEKGPLEVGSLYWELRDSLVNCELLMLRTLQFHVAFDNPHKYLLHYLNSLEDWADSKTWNPSPVSQLSWSLLQDSFHSTVCLQYSPSHVAISVIFFALMCLGVTIPSQGAQHSWWKALCPTLTEEELKKIIKDMIEFYSHENKVM